VPRGAARSDIPAVVEGGRRTPARRRARPERLRRVPAGRNPRAQGGARAGGRRVMASKAQQERRAEFKRYKEDVAKEGKPFFPYAILHDTIMSLVVVAVIIAL